MLQNIAISSNRAETLKDMGASSSETLYQTTNQVSLQLFRFVKNEDFIGYFWIEEDTYRFVIINKLGWEKITYEFDSRWRQNTSDLVPN